MCDRSGIRLVLASLFACLLEISHALADGIEVSGYLSIEPRLFVDDPTFSEQPAAGISSAAVLAPELRYEWNQGEDRLTVTPFVRFDANDGERTHADLRELLWLHARGPWTWQIGIGRVFWGVTESRHLVDIVNQTDLVEDVDEEDKLGQPLVAVERWTANAGSFSLFLLPVFRERTFPANDARLRGAISLDTGRAEYESNARSRRLDWALRWSHAISNWDLGASFFKGTSREPLFLLREDSAGRDVLIPRYDVITQFGLDIQYTKNAWLWKLEMINRRGHGSSFGAFVAGAEYTLFGLGSRGVDLGVLAEYLYDDRGPTAPPTLYDDDWFVGLRLGLNDTQDTAILAGAIVDGDGAFAVAEMERRIADIWRFEAEARWFLDIDNIDPFLNGIRNDSFFTLRLSRYF